MREIPWDGGRWSNKPVAAVQEGSDLVVTAEEGSDAWRLTSYGFVRDSEHALLVPFSQNCAMEVEFTAGFTEQFDQAGIFVYASPEKWVKTGLELSDGVLCAGAVVTDVFSDWSLSPVPKWRDQVVTLRVSREGNALTIRARPAGGPLQLLRVIPMGPEVELEAGPFVCAPSRAGLKVRFHSWRLGEADTSLH